MGMVIKQNHFPDQRQVSLLVGVFNCLNETVYAVKEGLPTVFKKKFDLATELETVRLLTKRPVACLGMRDRIT